MFDENKDTDFQYKNPCEEEEQKDISNKNKLVKDLTLKTIKNQTEGQSEQDNISDDHQQIQDNLFFYQQRDPEEDIGRMGGNTEINNYEGDNTGKFGKQGNKYKQSILKSKKDGIRSQPKGKRKNKLKQYLSGQKPNSFEGDQGIEDDNSNVSNPNKSLNHIQFEGKISQIDQKIPDGLPGDN